MRTSRLFRVGWRALLVLAVAAVPAFAAETVVDTIQGEDTSKVSGKRVEPVTVFYSGGRVEKNVNLPRRATKLVVKADSGPKCGDEWPHMVVEVDEVPVLSTTVQENGNTSSPVNVPAGRHTVAVSYDNDYYEPADAFTSNPAQAAHVRPQPDARRDRPARGREHRAGTGAAAVTRSDASAFADASAVTLAVAATRAFTAAGTITVADSDASAGERGRHPVDRRRGEAVGRLGRGQALARQQRMGRATAARTARASAR